MRATALKVAIWESGKTQIEVSEEAKVSRGYLSLALHGRYRFSDEEKLRIAKVLSRQVAELFPEA